MAIGTLGYIALGLTAAGTAVGMHGAVQEAKTAEKTAKYNAQVSRNNAQAAKDQASYEADRIRERRERLRGAQITAGAKSGRSFSGSLLDIQYDSDLQTDLDMLSAVYKGQTAARRSTAESHLLESQAKSARRVGPINAASTLLTGTGSAFSTTAGLLK